MRIKKACFAVTCLALTFPTLAQTKFLATHAEVKSAAESIVASIANGNFPAALTQIRPLSVLPSSELDVLEAQYATQSGTLLQRYGAPLGYELIREDVAGTSLLRYTFVVRYEKSPLRWQFVFYRGDKGWVSTDFKFDGNLGALLDAGG